MTRLALILALLTTPAQAHSWYDAACCDDTDCAPVHASVVRATADGWLVRIRPGGHVNYRKDQDLLLPYDDRKVRHSQDGEFHVCLSPLSNTIYCIYVPVMGF